MRIRTFLLLMLLSIITLVSFTAAITGYRASIANAEQVFDNYLNSFAHALAKMPTASTGLIPLAEAELTAQIWQHGALVSQSANAPTAAISNSNTGFGNSNFNGQRWRTYAWLDATTQRTIMVAQPLERRVVLAEEMAQVALTPLIIVTPLLALLIAFTITRALAPLRALSSKLQHREADDFTAIALRDSPAELSPVVTTINQLFVKVAQAFEREKRFASDAAHELRTPLSVLQVSIHNLREQQPELSGELEQLRLGVQRMSHVVEQILLLNRTHPDHIQKQFKRLNALDACQQAIAASYQAIADREQTVELQGEPAFFQGDSFAINSLLMNLLGNASKYSPLQGSILVSTMRTGSNVCISVEDSGPGIPVNERNRVLDRFYRIGGDQGHSKVVGCGLGMAIVSQVVEIHGGTIELAQSTKLGGLLVRVELPVIQ